MAAAKVDVDGFWEHADSRSSRAYGQLRCWTGRCGSRRTNSTAASILYMLRILPHVSASHTSLVWTWIPPALLSSSCRPAPVRQQLGWTSTIYLRIHYLHPSISWRRHPLRFIAHANRALGATVLRTDCMVTIIFPQCAGSTRTTARLLTSFRLSACDRRGATPQLPYPTSR